MKRFIAISSVVIFGLTILPLPVSAIRHNPSEPPPWSWEVSEITTPESDTPTSDEGGWGEPVHNPEIWPSKFNGNVAVWASLYFNKVVLFRIVETKRSMDDRDATDQQDENAHSERDPGSSF